MSAEDKEPYEKSALERQELVQLTTKEAIDEIDRLVKFIIEKEKDNLTIAFGIILPNEVPKTTGEGLLFRRMEAACTDISGKQWLPSTRSPIWIEIGGGLWRRCQTLL